MQRSNRQWFLSLGLYGMSRYLIQGACVLTLGQRTQNHPSADVLIDGDKIAEVGPNLRARDAETIDGTDSIVMPGMIDAHRHTRMSLLRNLDVGAEVEQSAFGPDDVYAATMVGLLGALEAGTTTLVDWAPMPDDPAYTSALLQAYADAGLRTVLVHSGDQAVDVGSVPNTTSGFASPHVRTAGVASLAEAWAAARARGQHIHAHAGLDPADAGAVAELGSIGALGSDVSLIHCTHLSDADFDAIAEHGARIVVAPTSEMGGSLGQPPLQKMLDRKIEPGLGVDDERLGSGDLFAQMRMANSVQHAAYFDLKLAGKAGLPNLLTTRDLIRYATSVGARSVGLDGVTGSIEPGKQADIILLRTDRPNIYPINDPIGAIVWGVDSSNLDWVFVAGRPVMRDGDIGVDVERVRGLAADAQQRVMDAAGLAVTLGGGA